MDEALGEDAGHLTGATDLRDRVRYYGIYGGTPRYLATIDPRRTLGENVTRAVLHPDGAARLQLETAVEQEGGLVSPAEPRRADQSRSGVQAMRFTLAGDPAFDWSL